MNDYLLQEEKRLCEKYGVSNIDQVLEKQKELNSKKMEGSKV
jgi:hypothetical protein